MTLGFKLHLLPREEVTHQGNVHRGQLHVQYEQSVQSTETCIEGLKHPS